MFNEDISEYISEDIKERAKSNTQLKKSLETAVKEIKEFLDEKGIDYKLKAHAWNDYYSEAEENAITVHLNSNNLEEILNIEEKVKEIVREAEEDDLMIYSMVKPMS